MTYFQQNAFGWYIMVIKDKKKAELIDKILNDYENDLKFAELKIKKKATKYRLSDAKI